MKLARVMAILLPSSSSGAAVAMTMDKLRGRAAVAEIVELCPNPDFMGINETVTCLNFTDPATPKGYGQRDTCISLEGSPLHVGAPQGVSSVRMYGTLNCTLYKTENCEPDTPDNGHIIPGGGESHLFGGAGPDDPKAIDDRTVAFRCRDPAKPGVHKYSSSAAAPLE
ncbi:hypothetical protein PG997_014437 [Apiospora hydei]|uniref:Uncharacterized protein n=1 Tax=Apiospora hydei TaxID=1337664 RepID=A0ABR1UTT8_9PEZI